MDEIEMFLEMLIVDFMVEVLVEVRCFNVIRILFDFCENMGGLLFFNVVIVSVFV